MQHTLFTSTKCILHTICLKYNLEVVLLTGSAKSYNYKHKMSKKYLPTIRLMAYMETAITYNLGSTTFAIGHIPTQFFDLFSPYWELLQCADNHSITACLSPAISFFVSAKIYLTDFQLRYRLVNVCRERRGDTFSH